MASSEFSGSFPFLLIVASRIGHAAGLVSAPPCPQIPDLLGSGNVRRLPITIEVPIRASGQKGLHPAGNVAGFDSRVSVLLVHESLTPDSSGSGGTNRPHGLRSVCHDARRIAAIQTFMNLSRRIDLILAAVSVSIRFSNRKYPSPCVSAVRASFTSDMG